MLAPLSILFGAVFTVASCIALGKLILRVLGLRFLVGEDHVFSFVAGAAGLSTLVFALAATGFAYSGVFLGVGVALIAIACWKRRRESPAGLPPLQLHRGWIVLFAIASAPFGVLYFFNAMAPETSPDGVLYHLALVGRYSRAHGFVPITTNIYASLSEGLEMLFWYAFAFGKHSAAALVHCAFLFTLPAAMILYARRFGFPWAGWCAAAFTFLTPVVGLDGVSAYNDVALACVLFALFYILEIWAVERNSRLLILAGLLAGFGFAIKYTAAVGLIYAVGFVLWKTRRERNRWAGELFMLAMPAAILILPWLVKNWIVVANPFSPFLNALFPNPYVHVSFERFYTWQLRHYAGIENYWQLPLAVTVLGTQAGILGPLYLLSPIALLALRTSGGRKILLAGLVFGLPFAANTGCRFLIPAVPFVAFAMALALRNFRSLAAVLMIGEALMAWPGFLQKRLLPPSNWVIGQIRIKEALRIQPEKAVLELRAPDYKETELINRLVPPDAQVLAISDIAQAYTSREVLVAYKSAFNESAEDLLHVGSRVEEGPVMLSSFRFPEQRLQKIRVVQTGTGTEDDVWNVSELRVFLSGQELPRLPEWRLEAHPNPWDVQLAFDNSPVTRWRSWQAIYSGMYIQVDFGKPQMVDRVLIEAPPAKPNLRMRLDGDDGRGGWKILTPEPHVRVRQPPKGLRREAVELLQARGVGYLLVRRGDEGWNDFQTNADQWGITQVGETVNARLYRLNPRGQ